MPLPYALAAPLPGALHASWSTGATAVTYTNAGLTLLADAWQTNGAQTAITYVALGLGCGTLASPLTSGTPYTAVPLASGLVAALSVGQSLTLIDSGGDTATLTVASPGASIGATSVPINSFTPSVNFAAGSGVTTTPAATDLSLFNEVYRLAALSGVAGATPGESLNAAYFDPSTPAATYVEVGYFGGSTASSSAGTGTLIARDVQFWAHTLGADSASFQIDTKLSLT